MSQYTSTSTNIESTITGNGVSLPYYDIEPGAQIIVSGPFNTGTYAQIKVYKGKTEPVMVDDGEYTRPFAKMLENRERTSVIVEITGAATADVHEINIS